MSEPTTTARTTLLALAVLVRNGMQPEGRANATASSLDQVGEIGGDLPLTLADAAAGFAHLAQPKGEGEPGNVLGRRKTCGELATLAGDAEGGNPANLAAVLRAQEKAFEGSEDPRQKAMADTARREAEELEALGQ
jgi:hypothetical protein